MSRTVAILNSNEDVIEMLRMVIEQAGFNTAATHVPHIKRGKEDFLEFLEKHDPAAVVYDIAPPYRENWTFFKMLSETMGKGRKFILTTANIKLLRQIADVELDVFEISEKPDNLEAILQAVKRAVGDPKD